MILQGTGITTSIQMALRCAQQVNLGNVKPSLPCPHLNVCNKKERRPSWHAGRTLRLLPLAGRSTTAGAVATDQVTLPLKEQDPSPQLDSSFSWTSYWWPVAPLYSLDTRKPTAVKLLGKQYAVWYDATQGQWHCVEDRCPHRLAPLSQGRVCGDGQLQCSYHGWRFDGTGACTDIPQVSDPNTAALVRKAPRSCATAHPTTIRAGMLFVWLGSQLPDKEPPVDLIAEMAGGADQGRMWGFHDHHADAVHFIEQAFDPDHASYLHYNSAKSIFKPETSMPISSTPIPNDAISAHGGFAWMHGGYQQGNRGAATRTLVPPYTAITDYSVPPFPGYPKLFQIMVVPQEPGKCRVFGGFIPPKEPVKPAAANGNDNATGLQKQSAAPAKKFSPLSWAPHWLLTMIGGSSTFVDEDSVIMSYQNTLMSQSGLSQFDYHLPSPADHGISAVRRWFKAAGYQEMWRQRAPNLLQAAKQDLPLEALLSRWTRHTASCVDCQRGLAITARIITALKSAAAALLAASAVVLSMQLPATSSAVEAASGAAVVVSAVAVRLWPGVLCAVLSLSAWCAALKLADMRERGFINGVEPWREKGGLALVKDK